MEKITIKSVDQQAMDVFKNITIVRENKNIRVPSLWADAKRIKNLLQNSQLVEVNKVNLPLVFVYPTKLTNESSNYVAVVLSKTNEDMNQIIEHTLEQLDNCTYFDIREINRHLDYLDILDVQEDILTTQIKFSILL